MKKRAILLSFALASLVAATLSCKKDGAEESTVFDFSVSVTDGVLSDDRMVSAPEITLTLSSENKKADYSASAVIDGYFSLSLPSLTPGEPSRLTITGAEEYGEHEVQVTVRSSKVSDPVTKTVSYYVRDAVKPEISILYRNGLGETVGVTGDEILTYIGEPSALIVRTTPAYPRLNVSASTASTATLSTKKVTYRSGDYTISLSPSLAGNTTLSLSISDLDTNIEKDIQAYVSEVPETHAEMYTTVGGIKLTDGYSVDRKAGGFTVRVVPSPGGLFWSEPSVFSLDRNVLAVTERGDGEFLLTPKARGTAIVYASVQRGIEWKDAYRLNLNDMIVIKATVNYDGEVQLTFTSTNNEAFTISGQATYHGYLSYTIATQDGTIPKTEAEAAKLNVKYEDTTNKKYLTIAQQDISPSEGIAFTWDTGLVTAYQSIRDIDPRVKASRWENHGSAQGYKIYTYTPQYVPVLDKLLITIKCKGQNPEYCIYTLTDDSTKGITVRGATN